MEFCSEAVRSSQDLMGSSMEETNALDEDGRFPDGDSSDCESRYCDDQMSKELMVGNTPQEISLRVQLCGSQIVLHSSMRQMHIR
ncbi:hypothetical protein NPIL_540431 [Nephila pilipes]|uniref:Uncharacterized protein n=1 Tax=Nephila pilipes TaxID=299642 RepID=A0A8X6PT52_NEPPI|nr:hypothetical protein NPIL_540431 [Nephila pilipes]